MGEEVIDESMQKYTRRYLSKPIVNILVGNATLVKNVKAKKELDFRNLRRIVVDEVDEIVIPSIPMKNNDNDDDDDDDYDTNSNQGQGNQATSSSTNDEKLKEKKDLDDYEKLIKLLSLSS